MMTVFLVAMAVTVLVDIVAIRSMSRRLDSMSKRLDAVSEQAVRIDEIHRRMNRNENDIARVMDAIVSRLIACERATKLDGANG